ncbi:unnamed protein product [Allacma fusca]|uniref:Kazal-like domain-containing protein n=1 Tax=Allacma fusca TaxID=39272 RepID=A0A8J2NSM2_9HEXA|nr:unnamed protein product [Allacma fusca]
MKLFSLLFILSLIFGVVVPACRKNCICPATANYVCATNGQTFLTLCDLRCEKKCDRRIKLYHKGRCGREFQG